MPRCCASDQVFCLFPITDFLHMAFYFVITVCYGRHDQSQIQNCLHAHHETALPATYWKTVFVDCKYVFHISAIICEWKWKWSEFFLRILNFKGDQYNCYLFLAPECYNAAAADLTTPSSWKLSISPKGLHTSKMLMPITIVTTSWSHISHWKDLYFDV